MVPCKSRTIELAAAVTLFLAAMLACLILQVTIIWALVWGICLFFLLAVRSGQTPQALLKASIDSTRSLLGLSAILLLLGALTASWRISGTVLLFVYYGVQMISPPLFLLITFLITCVLSYILGTCFGVSGIMGAIFMTIGAAGNVNPLLTAGVIMSGIYFGDRTSPAAASFLTINVISGEPVTRMLRSLLRGAVLPLGISAVIYGFLSVRNPLQIVDNSILSVITDHCRISLWLLLPAVFILFFPLLRLKIWQAMLLSIATAGILSLTLQKETLSAFLRTCLLGYTSSDAALGTMLNGGGMTGMVEICVIVCLSSILAPLLQSCGLNQLAEPILVCTAKKVGVTTVTTVVLGLMNAIFCNQTASLYLTDNFMQHHYQDKHRFAIDLCEASILAGIIPWSLACSVPLQFIGVGPECLPFAFFIYLAPLCNCIKSRK